MQYIPVIFIFVLFAIGIVLLVREHLDYRRRIARMTPEERKAYDLEITRMSQEW